MNQTKTLIALAFLAGYFVSDIVNEGTQMIPEANSAVGGMNYTQLRRDRDFQRAVQYIVEDCYVSGGSISC